MPVYRWKITVTSHSRAHSELGLSCKFAVRKTLSRQMNNTNRWMPPPPARMFTILRHLPAHAHRTRDRIFHNTKYQYNWNEL